MAFQQWDFDATVSVIVPTFNAARTVARAIDSVVAQTFTDWRLICVDDASHDGTADVVAGYASSLGPRLTVIRSDRNGGPSAARNRGLDASRGAWLAMLDADDAWHPERLARLLHAAEHADADVVCDNLLGFDDGLGQNTRPLFSNLPRTLDVATVVAAEYGGSYNLGYLKPLVRRSVVREDAIRYDEVLRTGEDLLFLLECLAAGARACCLDWPGYVYTTPVGDTTRRLSRSTHTRPRDIDLMMALRSYALRHRDALTQPSLAAIAQRIAYLEAIAPLAAFRHARLDRDWATAIRLLIAEPKVRRRAWAALRLGSHIPRSRES